MSDTGKMTAAPISGVLDKYSIPVATIADIEMVESFLERRHLNLAAGASVGLPEAAAVRLINAATDDIVTARLKYGKPAFYWHITSRTMQPFLLHVLLRNVDPKMTVETATNLFASTDEIKIRDAIAEQFGFPPMRASDPNVGVGEASTGTGSDSSKSSEPPPQA